MTEQVITLPSAGKLEDAVPSANWTPDQLGKYAKYQDEQGQIIGRQLAVHRFRQGHALTLAKERIEKEQGYGHWGLYLKEHGISTSSDDRARKLYAAAGTEEALAGMQITEAYQTFGVEKPKAEEPKEVQQVARKSAKAQTTKVSKTAGPPFRRRLEKEFDQFAAKKGWDEDRKLQVLTELSSPDPWNEIVDDLLQANTTDIVIEQLHQYYGDEPDYAAKLLEKVESVCVSTDLIDQTIARLVALKETLVNGKQAA